MQSFVQSQPDLVARLITQIESPAMVDLLLRIIQLEEQATDSSVLEVRLLVKVSMHGKGISRIPVAFV